MLAHDKESGLGSPTYVIENIQESEKKTESGDAKKWLETVIGYVVHNQFTRGLHEFAVIWHFYLLSFLTQAVQ